MRVLNVAVALMLLAKEMVMRPSNSTTWGEFKPAKQHVTSNS